MRDFGGPQRAEAAALSRRRGKAHLACVEIAWPAQRLRRARADDRDDVAALKRDLCARRKRLAWRIGLRRRPERLHHDNVCKRRSRSEGHRDCCAPQQCLLTHLQAPSFKFAKSVAPAPFSSGESNPGAALARRYARVWPGSINRQEIRRSSSASWRSFAVRRGAEERLDGLDAPDVVRRD